MEISLKHVIVNTGGVLHRLKIASQIWVIHHMYYANIDLIYWIFILAKYSDNVTGAQYRKMLVRYNINSIN